MIRTPDAIREAYRDREVASEYVDQRFAQPLGALLHARQRDYLRALVRQFSPRSILEIAPGPARLTLELADRPGIAIDASPEMLSEARWRMRSHGVHLWRFVQGDVFDLPFAATFDLIYSFRLVRHFDRADRERIYKEVVRVLRPGGLFVFDAVNEKVSRPIRLRAKPGEYAHYDALFTEAELRSELEANGLAPVALQGVQHRFPLLGRIQTLAAPRSRTIARFAMELVDRSGGAPLEWIVTCRRL